MEPLGPMEPYHIWSPTEPYEAPQNPQSCTEPYRAPRQGKQEGVLQCPTGLVQPVGPMDLWSPWSELVAVVARHAPPNPPKITQKGN